MEVREDELMLTVHFLKCYEVCISGAWPSFQMCLIDRFDLFLHSIGLICNLYLHVPACYMVYCTVLFKYCRLRLVYVVLHVRSTPVYNICLYIRTLLYSIRFDSIQRSTVPKRNVTQARLLQRDCD